MSEASSVQATEQSKPSVRRRATGTDTVTVACNLPNGLILQLYTTEENISFLPNGREIKEMLSTPDFSLGRWALNGMADFATMAQAGRDIPDYRIIKGTTPNTGYALTSGIPREFWDEWLKRNSKSPLVTGNHVYAMDTEDAAVGIARDFKNEKSGFQGLNQTGDYRVPKGPRKFDTKDQTADVVV